MYPKPEMIYQVCNRKFKAISGGSKIKNSSSASQIVEIGQYLARAKWESGVWFMLENSFNSI
jgi:hypothetical protein